MLKCTQEGWTIQLTSWPESDKTSIHIDRMLSPSYVCVAGDKQETLISQQGIRLLVAMQIYIRTFYILYSLELR